MHTQVTAPSERPVTVADCKAAARVLTSAEDALILGWIDAAVQDAEHLMQRAVMPQQWQLTLDSFDAQPDGLVYLRRPRVTAVDAVKYIDGVTGNQLTLASTEWLLDASSDLVARLAPAYGKSWPSTRVQLGAVQVLFTCGWANAAAVPALVKSWIVMRVAAYYQNREAWTLGKTLESNPWVDRMLDRWAVTTV